MNGEKPSIVDRTPAKPALGGSRPFSGRFCAFSASATPAVGGAGDFYALYDYYYYC